MKNNRQKEEERRQAINAGWTTYDRDIKDLRMHTAMFIASVLAVIVILLKK